MTSFSPRVTVFALAAPAAALLASHPVLASLGHRTTIGHAFGFTSMASAAVLVGLGAAVWASATVWTARARTRQDERREWLHQLLEAFDAAIILTDVRGTITTMNHAAESMTGWQEAAAVGFPVGAVFQLVDRPTHQRVVNPVVKALYKNTVVGPSADTLLLSKDGHERQIRDTAMPIRDSHGRVVGCALVCRDADEPFVRGRRVEIQDARP